MFNVWKEKIHGEDVPLREKIFYLMLFMVLLSSILSFVAGVFRQDVAGLLLPMLIPVPIVIFSFWYTMRYRKVELPAVLVDIAIHFILIPLAFFTRGGADGGTAVWFILAILYVFLMFHGRLFYVMLTVTLLMIIGLYSMSYVHPEWVIGLANRAEVYTDSVVAVILAGIICGCLVKFQNRIYAEEKEITEQQKEEIEQLSRSRSAFFTNMSHEIRTPINTIIGLNEMTLRENISDEIAENSINIQNASKMLLVLINDILDMSKIESGKMQIVPVQYDTGNLFSDLVNLIWIRAYEKKLEFKIDISEDIPSTLFGDEVRIKQVLTNILTNAVKYTNEGSVTLSVQSEQMASNIVRLRISVSDTGIGIRKEDMENLFHSFKRVDEARNRGIEGTGLGLTISKQLVEMMGGKITVDSIYTKGTVFTVILDQKIVDGNPIGSIDFMLKKKSLSRSNYKQSFEAPDAKVLIVDDNEMNLLVACKLLRSTKVQVDTAASGKECLEKTRHKYYNVIFMDHMMPEMDGIETLKQLRVQEDGLCKDTPVIALTAHAMSGAEQLYIQNGFQGYLSKPISGTLLEAVLLKYLPKELVEYTADAEEVLEEQKTIRLISKKRKRSVTITTDCVCDLPEEWLHMYNIKNMYYYVYTDEGRFCDTKEISSDGLLQYIEQNGRMAHSKPASVSEYENFFANVLEESESVIHISMTSLVSEGYAQAVSAAKGFDNVTVIDSKHLSSAMGIMVLYAGKLAKEGKSKEEIIAQTEKLKERVSTSFIVPTPDNLYRNGKIKKHVKVMCEVLNLHPVIEIRQGRMGCACIETGNVKTAYKKYIRRKMRGRRKIDNRILFITYAGCSVKTLELIEKEVERYMKFEKVIFQPASATISSNCGLGAFGLLYLKKK